jgi:hypothetical protein
MVANVPESAKCVQHFLTPPRGDYGFTEYLQPFHVPGTLVGHRQKKGRKHGRQISLARPVDQVRPTVELHRAHLSARQSFASRGYEWVVVCKVAMLNNVAVLDRRRRPAAMVATSGSGYHKSWTGNLLR